MTGKAYHLLIPAAVSLLTSCGGGSSEVVPVSDIAYAVAIQADTKIVATGHSCNVNTGCSTALARYHSNGALDASFGSGGKVLDNYGGFVRAVAIQSDGKILVSGYNINTIDSFLLRYNSNGSLDSNFGTYGKIEPVAGGATDILIQGDGKVLTAGTSISRFNSNGTPDLTFGTAGIAANNYGVSSIAIQTDDKIVATGGSYITRYNSDGSVDTSFGADGEVYTGSPYALASAVAVQADGKIVISGGYYSGTGSNDFALTRYNSNGGLDTTFGETGRVIVAVSSLYTLNGATIEIDPISGKIVAAGFSPYTFVLTRYNADGSPDSTFNSGGVIITTGGGYWTNDSEVHGMAVQSDNAIVVVGHTYSDDVTGDDFALARHNDNGTIDTTFGTNGRVTTDF